MKIQNILWDLDGTLTDPKLGIIQSIQYALKKAGHIVPPMDELLWCIGPPLYESFPILAPKSSKNDVLKLVDFYRERFSDVGLYENQVFPEIPSLLSSLKIQKANYLATSKPHVYAKKILSHFELSEHFSAIHGSELSGERSDKKELIKYILQTEKLEPETTIMIGDRKHDIVGAKHSKLTSIGITWGYGSYDELKNAGADYIFSSPHELGEFLGVKR